MRVPKQYTDSTGQTDRHRFILESQAKTASNVK